MVRIDILTGQSTKYLHFDKLFLDKGQNDTKSGSSKCSLEHALSSVESPILLINVRALTIRMAMMQK